MSLNQCMSETSESQLRKVGRSGSSGQQRSFSAGGRRDGGGTAAPPSSSSSLSGNQNFKKLSKNAQGGQSRVSTTSANSESNASAKSAVQIGAYVQPLLHGVSDAPASGVPSKLTDLATSRSIRPVLKAPAAETPDSAASATPANGDALKASPLLFGSFDLGFVTGIQLQSKKDVSAVEQEDSADSHPPSQAKRDAHAQVPSEPATPTTRKTSAHPVNGMMMPFQQPQVSIQFGAPSAQMSQAPAGRIIDRPNGVSRADAAGTGMADDDKWRKSPGPFASGRDPRLEIPHGGAVVGFGHGQGGIHCVLRNSLGQPSPQYVGGILAGPLQPLVPQGGGIHLNNSDTDRWQRATGIQKGLISSPRTPVQMMMHRVEKRKQRQLKAILNKLTPQNFYEDLEQVKEIKIDNIVTLCGVVSQIFDKALMEPTFCEMYAKLCLHLASALPVFNEDNEKITFKRLLLNKCQEEFERGERGQAEANRDEEEGQVKMSEEEREEKKTEARRRMLGNIQLIGELYKKKMLTERIMPECIKKLLGQDSQYQNPDEEDVEALCKLMSTIGEIIDHPKAKEYMDANFEMMTKLSNNMKLSSRVRFMLKDTIELRKNKWQSHI